jgi:hypothetical protein
MGDSVFMLAFYAAVIALVLIVLQLSVIGKQLDKLVSLLERRERP